MHRSLISMLIILLVVSLISNGHALDDGIPRKRVGSPFCYEDEQCGPTSSLWDGDCKSGLQQSPINLNSMLDSSAKVVTLDFNDKYHSKG